MNLEHTEERRMLADTLNRYVAEQYGFETRNRIAVSQRGYSPEQWREFADLGAIGALFSEADGGFGGTGFDIAVVFEALGRGLVVEPFLGCAVLAGSAIAGAGAEGAPCRNHRRHEARRLRPWRARGALRALARADSSQAQR
jgi:alkylation response protein AidB-like acyl-CoA dehydrogenase